MAAASPAGTTRLTFVRFLLADDQEKRDKFDEYGQQLGGYISLDQARVLAMRTARETPGAYGGRFRNVPMAFEVAGEDETEDHYVVTLSFRPQGEFTGATGQEQFFIEKDGAVAHRQVLSLPKEAGRGGFPVVPTLIGVVVVVIVAAVGVVLASGGLGGEKVEPTPVARAAPPNTPLTVAPLMVPPATPTPTPTTVPPTPTRVPPIPTPTPVPLTPVRTVAPIATTFDSRNIRAAFGRLPDSFAEFDPAELAISVSDFGEDFTSIASVSSEESFEYIIGLTGQITSLRQIEIEREMSSPETYLEEFVLGFVEEDASVNLLDVGFLGVPQIGDRSLALYVVFERYPQKVCKQSGGVPSL